MLVFMSFGLQLKPRQFLGPIRLPAFDAEVGGNDFRLSAYSTSRSKFSVGFQDSQGKAFVPLYEPKVVAIIGDHNRSGFSCAKCD